MTMDTLTVDGKTYVKAAKAAAEAGYTADYVGQLCRKKKLDATVIGKTWYVREGALREHKESKVRTNAKSTQRDLQKQKQYVAAGGGSYVPTYRRRLLESNIEYMADAEELIPSIAGAPAMENTEEIVHDSGGFDVSDVQEEPEEPVDFSNESPVAIRRLEEVEEDGTDFEEEPLEVSPYIANYTQNQPQESSSQVPAPVPERRVTRRRSLVPMVVTAGLFLLLLANVMLESTWSYAAGETSSQVSFRTVYGVTSPASVIEAFRDMQF